MQFQTTQQSICSASMLLKHWLHSSWIVHHIDPVVPALGSNDIVHCFRGFPASVTPIFPGFDQSRCAELQQTSIKILHARHKQRIDSYRGPAARFSSKDLENSSRQAETMATTIKTKWHNLPQMRLLCSPDQSI